MIIEIGNRLSTLDTALLDMETKMHTDMAELEADRDRLIRARTDAHQAELSGIAAEYDMMARILTDHLARIAEARGAEPAPVEYREAAE